MTHKHLIIYCSLILFHQQPCAPQSPGRWLSDTCDKISGITKTVFFAMLFLLDIIRLHLFPLFFLMVCKLVFSILECSVWCETWRVCVRSLPRKRVSPLGRAGPVWYILFEAQSLLSAERWQEGPSLSGMLAYSSFIWFCHTFSPLMRCNDKLKCYHSKLYIYLNFLKIET